jgi:ribose-phosphate pyrophosphokinase
VVVDDMISTGATIEATMNVIVGYGGVEDFVVAATHGLMVGGAIDRISRRGMRRLLVTDTVTTPEAATLEVCSVAGLLGDALGRLHRDEPLDDLLLHA